MGLWSRLLERSLVTKFVFMLTVCITIPIIAIIVSLVGQQSSIVLTLMEDRASAKFALIETLTPGSVEIADLLPPLLGDPSLAGCVLVGPDRSMRWFTRAGGPLRTPLPGGLGPGGAREVVRWATPAYFCWAKDVGRASKALLVLFFRRDRLEDALRPLVETVLYVGIAAIIVAFCLAVAMARIILRPIETFVQGMRVVSEGRFPQKLFGARGTAELGELQETFEQMVEHLEQKKRIEQLVATQEKMASVGRLAASVAHEIRNPLASISSLTQLIATESRAAPKIEEYTAVVLKEVERLKEAINELLAYARPLPTRFSENKLSSILEGVILLLGFEARRSGVNIEQDFDLQSEFPLHVDENKLRQVFINVITNALQAVRGDRGHLLIQLRFRKDPDAAVVVFQDDGRGIAADRIGQIFEPFHSSRAHGSGLGLAIAARIVELHQGTIAVESEEGIQTTFTITLPKLTQDELGKFEEEDWATKPREIR